MYREILTKAIIAKGEKTIQEKKAIDVHENVSKVLGCWIINHHHEVSLKDQSVYIEGHYDVYLWYGFNQDSDCGLHKETFCFSYEIPYTFTQETSKLSSLNQIKEYVIKNPSCTSMTFDHSLINIEIEVKYFIDIIGETKLKIKVDDVIIDQMINTDYMKEKK